LGDDVSEMHRELLLDRIEICVEIPRVDYEMVSGNRTREMSESIRVRVEHPRDISKNSSRTIAHPTSSAKRICG